MAKTRRHKNSKHLVKSRRGNKSRVNRKTKVRRRKRLSKRRGGGGRLRAMVTRMRPRSGVSKKKPKSIISIKKIYQFQKNGLIKKMFLF